ncbi:hypothetical protein M1O24_01385, partial [Dehalococcoidia bacterium]|nr:hypothetical protein [Dehalococcoidia bacterium]
FDPAAGEPTFESLMTIVATTVATLGEHEITITGTSATAEETATFTLTVTRPEYEITLKEGWNLISLPLIPEDPAIEVVLEGILDDVIRVWHFDAETGKWKSFSPGGAPDKLTEMVDGRGYWINMAAAATLTVIGTEMPAPPAPPPEYPVFEGWNHIGFSSITEMTVSEYLGDGIMEIFVRMWGFDAETGWFRVIPGCPEHQYLQPGRGYWLAVSEDGIIFPAGEILE